MEINVAGIADQIAPLTLCPGHHGLWDYVLLQMMLAGQDRAICTLWVGGAVCHVLLEDGGSLFLESLNCQRDFTKFVFSMIYLATQWAYRLAHRPIVALFQDYGIFKGVSRGTWAPHILKML